MKVDTTNADASVTGGVDAVAVAETENESDPRVNEHGVYVEGVEEIEIELPKTTQAHCTLYVVQCADGRWRWAFETGCRGANYFGFSGPIMEGDANSSPTRNVAILRAVGDAFGRWTEQPKGKQRDKVIEIFSRFEKDTRDLLANEIENNESDEADDDEADCKTSNGEHDNKTSGGGCDGDWPDADVRFEQEVVDAERELIDSTLEQYRIEAEHKSAKTRTKEAKDLLMLLRARGPKPMPLFDKPKRSGPEPETEETEGQNESVNEPSETTEDKSWRETTTEALGLSPGVCEILRENEKPITTLGELADWTSEYDLLDIPRIGKAKVDIIDETIDKFWKDRKDWEYRE